MILELPIRHDSKRHMIVITLVGGGGGGGGDGIVHNVHKINTALCAKLIMTFALASDGLLFM